MADPNNLFELINIWTPPSISLIHNLGPEEWFSSNYQVLSLYWYIVSQEVSGLQSEVHVNVQSYLLINFQYKPISAVL